MRIKKVFQIFATALLLTTSAHAAQRDTHTAPEGFAYLKNIAPTIQQDIRYAGRHNFTGHHVKGYKRPVCILTPRAAHALARVQKALKSHHLSLKVYDCYRPQRTVNEFVAWTHRPFSRFMKKEFYPDVSKRKLIPEGYIAGQSAHSRASTVDLTLVNVPTPQQPAYAPGTRLTKCTAPYGKRFKDNSIDMGTGFDCFDPRAHFNAKNINKHAKQNRALLRRVMVKNGFAPYENEWWHFTLRNEPYPNTYFNFAVK